MSSTWPVPLSAKCSTRRRLLRTPRSAKEARRCRTTRDDVCHAMSRVRPRPPRASCVCRSVLQQEERHHEHASAENCGDAEAPPLSALFPQGSTLLRGQCTRADNNIGGGDGENIRTQRRLVQMKMSRPGIQIHFPWSGHDSRAHSDECPSRDPFFSGFSSIFPAQRLQLRVRMRCFLRLNGEGHGGRRGRGAFALISSTAHPFTAATVFLRPTVTIARARSYGRDGVHRCEERTVGFDE